MPQDIQQQPWSQYFDSGEHFGNWFNSQLQQQQKLKFEQARAIIDDEFQRQRLGQQQQGLDQTGAFQKQELLNTAAQQALTAAAQKETNRHNLELEKGKPSTPEDWQKMFMGFAGGGAGQGGMPIGSALDLMASTPDVTVSPEQRAAAMGSAAKVQGPSPVNMGVNVMGGLANALGGVPGGPGLPPTEMQTPPPDQAFLPGTQEAMARKEALTKQSNARAAYLAWQQTNGDKITKIKQDAAIAHAKTSMLDEQIKQNKLDMAKKWGDRLNQLKIDANDIHSYNAATMRWGQMLRQNESTTADYKQAKDNARFLHDVVNSQLSDVNKQVDAVEKELDANNAHKNLVGMEADALRGVVGDATEGQAYMQFLEKQADHTAAMQTSIQLKAKLQDLKTQQKGLQGASQDALSLFTKQQQRGGSQIPIPQAPGGSRLNGPPTMPGYKGLGTLPSISGLGVRKIAPTYSKTATNPKTGEKVGWDGTRWVPISK